MDRYDCPMHGCDWYTSAPTPDPEGLRTEMPHGVIAEEIRAHLKAVHSGRIR